MFTTFAFEMPTVVEAESWSNYDAAYHNTQANGNLLTSRFLWGASETGYTVWGANNMSFTTTSDLATRITVTANSSDPFGSFPLFFDAPARTSHDGYVLLTYTLPAECSSIGYFELFIASANSATCNPNVNSNVRVISNILVADGKKHTILIDLSGITGKDQMAYSKLSFLRFDLVAAGNSITKDHYIDLYSMVFCDTLNEAADYADDNDMSIAHCTYNAWDQNNNNYDSSTSNQHFLKYSISPPSTPSKTGYNFYRWKVTVDNNTFNAGDTVDYVGANESYVLTGVYPVSMENDTQRRTNQHINVYFTPEWTPKTYRVRWYNGSTLLETDSSVAYGTTPTYNGSTPTKASTAQYDYKFSGWSPSVGAITGATDYYAQFSSTTRSYTITFKNWDGTVLSTQSVAYGSTPTAPSNPTKPSDSQYTYAFAGWDSTVSAVTGDKTYTATYTPTTRSYTITWLNWDGSSLGTTNVAYGQTPVAPVTPTKPSTAEYTYTFAGWTPAVSAVTGAATYTATFTETKNQYTVTWLDGDGETLKTESLDYGATPSYTGATPTKADDNDYTYTFNGSWSPAITTVTGNVTYTAQFDKTPIGYTVTWVNWDGSELEVDTKVKAGTTPSYDGADPTRPATDEYNYTFTGWSPEISAVTGNVTYTAQYAEAKNKYTITFVDEDGSTVLQSSEVEYGTLPSYTGETPTKEGNAQFSYTFNGWTPNVAAVTGNATYRATYAASVNSYTVKFVNYDGSELQSTVLSYGTLPTAPADPTRPADAQYTYTFKGWDKNISPVTGAVTYTAQYTATINKYTVNFVDDDGEIITSEEVEYGNMPTIPANPSKAADAQYTYTFKEWSPAVVEVTGAATYTATYSSTLRTYPVIFLAENGSTVIKETAVEYGAMPTPPDDPVKYPDAQYNYTFAGWTPDVVAVTGPTVYKATFDKTLRKYTVNFVDDDGTVLQSEELEYGQMPVYSGETPTKNWDFTYTKYEFDGWDPEIVSVTGNATYTAKYTSSPQTYLVDCDTSLLVPDYPYTVNTDIPIPGATENEIREGYNFGWKPTQYKDDTQTVYIHNWEMDFLPAGVPIADGKYNGETLYGNVKLVATWVPIEYTISYDLAGGSVDGENPVQYTIESDTITLINPERAGYIFLGWTGTGLDEATLQVTIPKGSIGDRSFTAQWQKNTFTITWLNHDGTVLETDDDVEKGTLPSYDGSIPTRDNDSQYSYTFAGWDPEIVAVTGDATYTAIFTSTARIADMIVSVVGTSAIDENQSYIFDIINSASSIIVTVAVHGDSSVTVKNVPVGTYTVKEQDGWSWRYTNDYSVANGAQSVTITPAPDTADDDKTNDNTAYFTQTRAEKPAEKALWLGGDSYKKKRYNPYINQ